ncbi:MAG: hypothetical protein IKP28_06795 [Clostridia bacterium]|nr:hypothetical protein [Clostridia bacterium]
MKLSGQLVESNVWYDKILDKIKSYNVKVKEVEIRINPEDINSVVGHKKENVTKLKNLYDVKTKIVQDEKIKKGSFNISILQVYNN